MAVFKAKLIRERFVLRKKNKPDEEPQIALANRLEIECHDSKGKNPTSFVVRAQNIHTTLRIAARIAQHWYDHGKIIKEGRNRFSWQFTYKEATKDFEEKWNPNCWACVYKNGKIFFGAEPPGRTKLLDVIEQVYTYEKGNYNDIAAAAEKMFAKAGKDITIEYDGDIALELEGSSKEVINKIIYRDSDGRNIMNLLIRQKAPKHIKDEDAASPIKLSESLTVSAVIFEGYQLGFIAGHTNYQLSSGQITLADQQAQKTDHAIKRIRRLEKALKELTEKHYLVFKPKPDFQNNTNKVENFFREQAKLASKARKKT